MITAHRYLRRCLLTLLTALPAVALLAGCTAAGSYLPSSTRWPVPTAHATADAVQYPLPDIGPSPAPSPRTAEEIDAQRLAEQDQRWEEVTHLFPAAVRPVIEFDGYPGDDTVAALVDDCLQAAGFTPAMDDSRDGEDQAMAVLRYTCLADNPYHPFNPPNDAQLGYIYDYLTEFMVPCFEANGISNPAPPSRADFIALWPNQQWFPSTGEMPMGTAEDTAIHEACPTLP
ncbi:MAG: hypothetical protein JWQ43_4015 [Glaciihabitans sp.]|nr:hypothetical protein [Glaciihabitans sp.]